MSDRFWLRVRRVGGCWVWQGPVDARGYGVCGWRGVQGAHRVAWVKLRGPVGRIRNVCGNVGCVCPDHWVEPVRVVGVIEARRIRIIQLWRSGKRQYEIACELGLSRGAVGRHLRGVEGKMNE